MEDHNGGDEQERLRMENAALRAELDRARAEAVEARGSSDGRFREAFEAAPFFMAIVRASDGRWVEVNEAFLKGAGFAREEVLGKTGLDLGIWVDRSDRESTSAEALGGVAGFKEARVRAKDGSERVVVLSARRLDLAGEPHLLWVGADVTELRHAEDVRRNLEAQLLRAQKLESLGLMAGGIAHDFNNILHGILGHAELLQIELPAGSSAREMSAVVGREARRAADLAAKMLAYSGRAPFAARPVDMAALADGLCRDRQAGAPAGVTLTCVAEPELPGIAGDEAQLRQLVEALLTNALEALPSRGGRVSARMEVKRCGEEELASPYLDDRLPEGDYLVLTVEDDGAGMPDEACGRAFDPFYTTKFIGRGLGLSVVLGVARGHGGTARIHSSAGEGTSAAVYLPIAGTPGRGHPRRVQPRGPDRGRKVLVVDDERTVRLVAERMLTRSGFEVVTVGSGREALELLAHGGDGFGLVLLDLSMPGLTGEATLEEIAGLAPGLPVVISSAYAEDEVRARLGGEMPPFVQKPYGLKGLLEAVGKALGEVSGRSESRGPTPG